jgi:hypothetical protein
MTAEEALASHRALIDENGQLVAIGRYTGTGPDRPRTDTPTMAYVRYYASSELKGTIVQGDQVAIVLVDGLSGILPVTVNDKLIVDFEVIDGVVTMVDGATVRGKEFAIKNPMKRVVGGTLIALEIHSKG